MTPALKRAIHESVCGAGVPKRAKRDACPHLLATHLLEDDYHARTVQELLGQTDMNGTMVYTHVPERGLGSESGDVLDRRTEIVAGHWLRRLSEGLGEGSGT